MAAVEKIPNLQDERLMVRYAGGDATAFDTLYGRYEDSIYGFCLRMLGDADAAADAFQDTFIRLVDMRNAYKPRGRFRSWLFTIARNICLDQLRRGRRRVSLGDVEIVDHANSAGGAVEFWDEVARVLARIPAEQREIILMHRYYGFSYWEIARISDTTEAAVKQKAYRAMQTLHPSSGGRAS